MLQELVINFKELVHITHKDALFTRTHFNCKPLGLNASPRRKDK